MTTQESAPDPVLVEFGKALILMVLARMTREEVLELYELAN